MQSCELVISISSLACYIAEGKSADEIALIASILTAGRYACHDFRASGFMLSSGGYKKVKVCYNRSIQSSISNKF